MTTIGHGLIPVTATVALSVPFGVTPASVLILGAVSILTTLWSMEPDIEGIKGGSHRGNWERYNSAHSGEIARKKYLLPCWRIDKYFYLAHIIWIDKYFHKPEGGWKPSGYVLEVLIDALCVTTLILVTDLWFTVGIVLALSLYFVANILGEKDEQT